MSTTPIAIWERPSYEPSSGNEDGEAEVALFAFSRGELPEDVPFSMSRFGAPSREAAAALDVTTIARQADPAWFDTWRSGPLRQMAERDLPDLAELDAADHVHVVRLSASDPKDLVHLQTAWAAAKWLAERGASTVLDAHAGRFWPRDALIALDPRREVSIQNEVTIVAESDEMRGFGYAIHTRGMRKFGRRDVAMAAKEPGDPMAASIVHQLAKAQMLGESLHESQRIDLGESGRTLVVADYQPSDRVPELNLGNEGWLIALAAE